MLYARLRCPSALNAAKPQFQRVGTHFASIAHCARNRKKSLDEPFETSSPRRSSQKRVVGLTGLVFGRVWASPGPALGLSEALLASSWALLGVCWPSFERLLGALGRIWAPMGASRLVFTGFRVAPDRVLEGSGGSFRCDFRRQCVSYRREPSMAFTWAFRSPLVVRRYVRSTWNWSQVGHFGPDKSRCKDFLTILS